jgi:hypothetical protein
LHYDDVKYSCTEYASVEGNCIFYYYNTVKISPIG